ncbi:thiosulfate sulfurtransferase [Parvularcula lutaonensis]|nr:thiosulfate sulfurtransferase [Parvularcula lutaonensis]
MAFVDGSWFLEPGRDGAEGYRREHLPGAVFFDLDTVCDHASNLPHMLPSPEQFAHAVGQMGLTQDDAIVVYDQQGLFSAPRVWWTFRVMGARHVRVLNGGLPAWKAAGGKTSRSWEFPEVKTFTPSFESQEVVSHDEMRQLVERGGAQILDARPRGRFDGTEPEPRAGVSSGHMPGALSLPVSEVIRDGRMPPAEELRTIFEGLGIRDDAMVVTTCGSGVTAAVLLLALTIAGHQDVRLYDASWAGWASDPDAPIIPPR